MSNKTIREIAEAWKEYKRPYVKQSTMAAYVLILENHCLLYTSFIINILQFGNKLLPN